MIIVNLIPVIDPLITLLIITNLRQQFFHPINTFRKNHKTQSLNDNIL